MPLVAVKGQLFLHKIAIFYISDVLENCKKFKCTHINFIYRLKSFFNAKNAYEKNAYAYSESCEVVILYLALTKLLLEGCLCRGIQHFLSKFKKSNNKSLKYQANYHSGQKGEKVDL